MLFFMKIPQYNKNIFLFKDYMQYNMMFEQICIYVYSHGHDRLRIS